MEIRYKHKYGRIYRIRTDEYGIDWSVDITDEIMEVVDKKLDWDLDSKFKVGIGESKE